MNVMINLRSNKRLVNIPLTVGGQITLQSGNYGRSERKAAGVQRSPTESNRVQLPSFVRQKDRSYRFAA